MELESLTFLRISQLDQHSYVKERNTTSGNK